MSRSAAERETSRIAQVPAGDPGFPGSRGSDRDDRHDHEKKGHKFPVLTHAENHIGRKPLGVK